jgi:hypothetical protein
MLSQSAFCLKRLVLLSVSARANSWCDLSTWCSAGSIHVSDGVPFHYGEVFRYTYYQI